MGLMDLILGVPDDDDDDDAFPLPRRHQTRELLASHERRLVELETQIEQLGQYGGPGFTAAIREWRQKSREWRDAVIRGYSSDGA